jgi:DNA-binding beta-propeller fold protein YncE
VIDISARLRAHSISGIPNPQGVVYAPDAKKLFVASSKGKLRIFDGSNLELIKEIDFHGVWIICGTTRPRIECM